MPLKRNLKLPPSSSESSFSCFIRCSVTRGIPIAEASYHSVLILWLGTRRIAARTASRPYFCFAPQFFFRGLARKALMVGSPKFWLACVHIFRIVLGITSKFLATWESAPCFNSGGATLSWGVIEAERHLTSSDLRLAPALVACWEDGCQVLLWVVACLPDFYDFPFKRQNSVAADLLLNIKTSFPLISCLHI